MKNYTIIIKINKRFKIATFTDEWMANFAYDSMVAEFVKRTQTREFCGEIPQIILANEDNETIIKECLVTDGTIFQQ